MKYKVFIPLLSIIVMLATPLFANPDGRGHGDKHRHAFEELNLTDEQHTQLKLLKLDMQKEQILHFDEVKKIRDKIKEELLKEKPSQTKLNEYSKELGKLHGKLSEKRMAHLLKVKEVLSREQFEKILSREFHKGRSHHNKKQGKSGGKGKKGF
jgi:Spy/CpxP family protein refolding chaperone